MQSRNSVPPLGALVLALILGWEISNAEVITTMRTFDRNVAASWQAVDFNNDGIEDISFDFRSYGLGVGSSVEILDTAGNGGNEVLTQGSYVLPLGFETALLLAPAVGNWQRASSRPIVWTDASPGELFGVGATGSGEFAGVKFAIGSDWHWGWIRFGPINHPESPLPPLPWPSVLGFAYETTPGAPILTPVPELQVWQFWGLSLALAGARRGLWQKEEASL